MDRIVECLRAVTLTRCCVQDIPQQMNGLDCGMFACCYIDWVLCSGYPTAGEWIRLWNVCTLLH